MEKKEKGAGQNPAPDGNNNNSISKIHNTCLFLFIVMLIMLIVGQHIQNDRMISIGVGIGFGVAMIEVILNTREDDEDE
jgi:hypothetical protein